MRVLGASRAIERSSCEAQSAFRCCLHRVGNVLRLCLIDRQQVHSPAVPDCIAQPGHVATRQVGIAVRGSATLHLGCCQDASRTAKRVIQAVDSGLLLLVLYALAHARDSTSGAVLLTLHVMLIVLLREIRLIVDLVPSLDQALGEGGRRDQAVGLAVLLPSILYHYRRLTILSRIESLRLVNSGRLLWLLVLMHLVPPL